MEGQRGFDLVDVGIEEGEVFTVFEMIDECFVEFRFAEKVMFDFEFDLVGWEVLCEILVDEAEVGVNFSEFQFFAWIDENLFDLLEFLEIEDLFQLFLRVFEPF